VSSGAWLLAAAAAVWAQQGAGLPAADPTADPPTLGARYAGVSPGADARNPLPKAATEPPRLVWTGFKMTGDRSQLFLQTTRPVTYDLGKPGPMKGQRGPVMSVFLRNCRIHLKNNGRRLDTRFFASPVAGVVIHQRRRDVELDISLKEAATPVPRLEDGPDGSQFIVLEFPPGRPAAAASEAPSLPAEGPAGR
jgi:hypothetical protein